MNVDTSKKHNEIRTQLGTGSIWFAIERQLESNAKTRIMWSENKDTSMSSTELCAFSFSFVRLRAELFVLRCWRQLAHHDNGEPTNSPCDNINVCVCSLWRPAQQTNSMRSPNTEKNRSIKFRSKRNAMCVCVCVKYVTCMCADACISISMAYSSC